MRKGKAIIVGGSIAGLSCAHALVSAGWRVVVIERSISPPQGSPTGAGIALDGLSRRIIDFWLDNQPQQLSDISFPLTTTQLQWIDRETKEVKVLARADNKFTFRDVYWSQLHGLLYNALPKETFLWGHLYLSSYVPDHDKGSVSVRAKNLETDEIVEINGDLLIGADGSRSSVRRAFLPELKLRYSGYCAWRGIYDFSGKETSEMVLNVRKAYPDLGTGIYFDHSDGTHTVFYELHDKRFNWIWFVNRPEPDLEGNSMTMQVTEEMVQEMHQEAEKIWAPEFVQVIKSTKKPFLNFICDIDPLKQVAWGNVLLVGDAAHAVTPHGARSTNMAIMDAAVLGKCVEKWGEESVPAALEEYQRIRLPVTTEEVLRARRMGGAQQGLNLGDVDPQMAIAEVWREHQNIFSSSSLFDTVPSILDWR